MAKLIHQPAFVSTNMRYIEKYYVLYYISTTTITHIIYFSAQILSLSSIFLSLHYLSFSNIRIHTSWRLKPSAVSFFASVILMPWMNSIVKIRFLVYVWGGENGKKGMVRNGRQIIDHPRLPNRFLEQQTVCAMQSCAQFARRFLLRSRSLEIGCEINMEWKIDRNLILSYSYLIPWPHYAWIHQPANQIENQEMPANKSIRIGERGSVVRWCRWWGLPTYPRNALRNNFKCLHVSTKFLNQTRVLYL